MRNLFNFAIARPGLGVTNAIKLEFFMTYDPSRDDNSGSNL